MGFVLLAIMAFWIIPSEKSQIENEEDNLKQLDSLGIAKFIQGKALKSFSFYKHPSVMVKNGKLQIVGNGRPSGLFLRFDLNPTKTYKMTISGTPKIGRTTFRLQYDNNPRIYTAAPDGSSEKIIQHNKEVEVLLYSDDAFSYTLASITIKECPLCKTNKDLKALTLKEIPELATALREDRKKAARLLLHWASNASDQALSHEIVSTYHPLVTQATASAAYYNIFSKDIGGVYCGGFSVFFDNVLKLFGYNSFTINFGDLLSDLTHVTVVIGDKSSGAWKYYIFDPTFNLTFRNKQLQMLSLGEVLDLFGSKKSQSIFIDEQSLDRRDYLVLKRESSKCEVLKYEKNGTMVCARPSFNFRNFLKGWNGLMLKNGYVSNL